MVVVTCFGLSRIVGGALLVHLKLKMTDKDTFADLVRAYHENITLQRLYPAKLVLENEELLEILVYGGENELEDWESLDCRPDWMR